MPNINPIIKKTDWQRPEDWLPMPTIGDNEFVGLFAVFEDGFNVLAIDKSGTASFIDWGDGTTETSTGVVQHSYTYGSIGGVVLQSKDGRSYKQVIVRIEMPNNATQLNVDIVTTGIGTNVRSQNWLDIDYHRTIAGTNGLRVSSQLKARYLQRVKARGITSAVSCIDCADLRIYDFPLDVNFSNNVQQIFENAGDVRDGNGQPINIDSQAFTGGNLFQICLRANVKKIGNITTNYTNAHFGSAFRESMIEEIGDISFNSVTVFTFFALTAIQLKKIGTISGNTISGSMQQAFDNARQLVTLVFNADMSGVTNTAFTFLNCLSLRRLILPNLTRGFDIRATQITGQNLQDLFTSLGTASGSQTITLPTFTIGEDTSIATTKGYTIAYA
jgi:hypothetical protein